MKTYLVRGLPNSIQQDGWWLDHIDPCATPPRKTAPYRLVFLAVGLVAITLIASSGVQPADDGGFQHIETSHTLQVSGQRGHDL